MSGSPMRHCHSDPTCQSARVLWTIGQRDWDFCECANCYGWVEEQEDFNATVAAIAHEIERQNAAGARLGLNGRGAWIGAADYGGTSDEPPVFVEFRPARRAAAKPVPAASKKSTLPRVHRPETWKVCERCRQSATGSYDGRIDCVRCSQYGGVLVDYDVVGHRNSYGQPLPRVVGQLLRTAYEVAFVAESMMPWQPRRRRRWQAIFEMRSGRDW